MGGSVPRPSDRRQRKFGTWASPISARTVAEQGLRLGFVALDGDDTYWLEGRPAQGGRNVLVRCGPDGVASDVTPPDHNVRTRVHEYGGGAFVVSDSVVYYSNFDDQRVYRIRVAGSNEQDPAYGPITGSKEQDRVYAQDAGRVLPFGPPEAITPIGAWSYADATVDTRRRRLICVREDHTVPGREAVTTLVSISLDRDSGFGARDSKIRPPTADCLLPTVVASGHDFYSTPRVSPDGSKLSWLAWRHPQMPWDGTELWVADITDAGSLRNETLVAGGARESIYQPGWLLDGSLCFASDRTGWWELYRLRCNSKGKRQNANTERGVCPIEPVLRTPLPEAEFGRPQWLFGWATWASVDAGHLVVTFVRRGRWTLATIDLVKGTLAPVATDLEPLEWLAATATEAVYVGASPTSPPAVVRTNLETGVTTTLRSSATMAFDRASVSVPEAIEFPTGEDLTAHALYYPPRSGEYVPPPDERPPLIVISHGGPTTQTKAQLDLQVQFWTTRGFAVVDVNYGGSSGYGRAYRERLNGRWGIVDVDDCLNAARYLVERGTVDAKRLVIRGGSAGGYTTLAALTFHPGVFAAGASYYGVSDAEALATDTHKFEARYLDGLIGPYPASKDVYRARSPIHFAERLSCALIFFQGLEDRIVPPSQSERMAAAVRAKGLPVAYLTFEGEQHGFRKAETIVRCLEAELYFYGAVLGFAPDGPIPPIEMDNQRRSSQ